MATAAGAVRTGGRREERGAAARAGREGRMGGRRGAQRLARAGGEGRAAAGAGGEGRRLGREERGAAAGAGGQAQRLGREDKRSGWGGRTGAAAGAGGQAQRWGGRTGAAAGARAALAATPRPPTDRKRPPDSGDFSRDQSSLFTPGVRVLILAAIPSWTLALQLAASEACSAAPRVRRAGAPSPPFIPITKFIYY